jgi:hypothetical protein
MQMSPFDALSDYNDFRSGNSSPHLHIEVSAMSRSRSPSPLSTSFNIKTDEVDKARVEMKSNDAYFQSYSSLLVNHQVGNNLHKDHSPKFQERLPIPLTRERAIDNLDLSSETGSCSSAQNSVTSHDLAINLLDAAIANCSSPDKITPRVTSTVTRVDSTSSVKNTPIKSESIPSRKSSGSDTSTRDRLARTVAEAIIAKLVKNSMVDFIRAFLMYFDSFFNVWFVIINWIFVRLQGCGVIF